MIPTKVKSKLITMAKRSTKLRKILALEFSLSCIRRSPVEKPHRWRLTGERKTRKKCVSGEFHSNVFVGTIVYGGVFDVVFVLFEHDLHHSGLYIDKVQCPVR